MQPWIFNQGEHKYVVLVDEVHFPEDGKMQIFTKREHYFANQDQISDLDSVGIYYF